MSINHKQAAIAELATKIKAAGFRVFIAKNGAGTYGFYTDAQGSRVVCFQYDLGGFKFSGNYRAVKSIDAKFTGQGWIIGDACDVSRGGLQTMLESGAPHWATDGLPVTMVTLQQHLAEYQRSSNYAEFGVLPDDVTHYGMTQDEARAKFGTNANFEGPLALCGNGSFHAKVTRDKGAVTCPYCIAKGVN